MSELSVRRLNPDGKLVVGGEELLDGPGIKWLELLGPDELTLKRLGERLKLHRLAVEDALHLDQRPKVEEYPEHLFLVVQGFTQMGPDICQIQLHEMHFFLGTDWILSVHEQPHPAIEAAAKRVAEEPSTSLGRGPDFVAYLVTDMMVDLHFPMVDAIGDAVDALEDRVFVSPDREQLERMFQLRKLLTTLRRVLSPQRDVVGLLSRSGVRFIQDRTTLYFRDVVDHLFRLYEQLDNQREVLTSVKDVYLSMVAQRTNDIIKQLTIMSALFLPLTFIVGFFGQNFDALNRPSLFWLMIGLLVVATGGTALWFKLIGWFKRT